METTDVKKVYCRVCGIKCKRAVKIFSIKGRGMGLHEKILKCLLLSVKKRDRLPTRVCYTCIERLDEFSQFNLLVRQAQIKLRTILKIHGVHVREEKNYELISTWKALLATQELDNGKGSSKGRKRKRKSEIRLDVSSDSETSDSSSDSEAPFRARRAILPGSGPTLNDSFSSSMNFANQRYPSTSTSILSNLNESNQERNQSSATTTVPISDPPKEEISLHDPVESPQIMPVSSGMMMPYQQPSSDNSLISSASSQPLLIPNQIPNSLFLYNRNNVQPPNVRMSPLYLVNLAYKSSETVPNMSLVNNSSNITERAAPVLAEAPLGQSYSSLVPPNSSFLPSERDKNVFTPPSDSLSSELRPLVGGVPSLCIPPPLCPTEHLPRSQATGDTSKEYQVLKPESIPETAQESVKDVCGLRQSSTNYAGIASSAVPCDNESSTNRNTSKNRETIGTIVENLPSPNSSTFPPFDKPPRGLNFQFSDISDDEASNETVKITSDLPCDESLSPSTLQKVTTEVPSAVPSVPKVTFKVVSQDLLSCNRSSTVHPLENIKDSPNEAKCHSGVEEKNIPSNCSELKSSTTESKGDTFGTKSCSSHSLTNLGVSDSAKSTVASSSEELMASEMCKEKDAAESSVEFALVMEEESKEDYLKIVSDTESDNLPLEEVRKDLISEAEISIQKSNAIPKSTPLVGVARKLFVSRNTSTVARKQVEEPIAHGPKIDSQTSSKSDNGKIANTLRKPKERQKTPQPCTSISDKSPWNLKFCQRISKIKCELCSENSPSFFNHVTEAMYHHQQNHRGLCCLFSCTKCNYVTGQLQNLRQHLLSSCSFVSSPASERAVENPVPEIKQENSQDYEQALLNLKNALRSVSMPRFRKLLTSCKEVLSPGETEKEFSSNSSLSISSPSSSNTKKETDHRSVHDPLGLKCYFCHLRFNSKADLQAHAKHCPSPEKERRQLDSPPAKKFKPADVFNSSLFVREGSYYSCIQCGKNFPSVFKAKMHATKSKSCRRTNQNTLTKDADSKWKSPDFNLPSTFRTEHYKRLQELQPSTSQSVMAKGSISAGGNLNLGMVFDIPPIKVEKEDVEEMLDVESHESLENYKESGDSSGDKEKGGNPIKDLRTTFDEDELKRVSKEKEIEKNSLDASPFQTQVSQLEENMDFNLGKVKVEKCDNDSIDHAGLKSDLNSEDLIDGSRKKSKGDSKLQHSGLDSTTSKKSSSNNNIDFNRSIVREYSTPFQVLRPADPQEPVVIPKVIPKTSKKNSCPQKSLIVSSSKTGSNVQLDVELSAESIKEKFSELISKASPAQDVKDSSEVRISPLNVMRKPFRPNILRPTVMAFKQMDESEKNLPPQKVIGYFDPIQPKEVLQVSKEGKKSEKSPEKTSKTSLPPIPPKPTPETLETSPSKMWLRNAEKYCMNKTQSKDPNRGLVLKVPLIKLTRLRLLNNGEVDISGIDLGNGKSQQSSSSSTISDKNDVTSKEANAKEGDPDKALICKVEPKEEHT